MNCAVAGYSAGEYFPAVVYKSPEHPVVFVIDIFNFVVAEAAYFLSSHYRHIQISFFLIAFPDLIAITSAARIIRIIIPSAVAIAAPSAAPAAVITKSSPVIFFAFDSPGVRLKSYLSSVGK
jgi:hypothetical protein